MRRSLRRPKRASWTREDMRAGKRALARAEGSASLREAPAARPAGRGRKPGSSRRRSGTIVPPAHNAQLLAAILFVRERPPVGSALTVREWDAPSDSEQREWSRGE